MEPADRGRRLQQRLHGDDLEDDADEATPGPANESPATPPCPLSWLSAMVFGGSRQPRLGTRADFRRDLDSDDDPAGAAVKFKCHEKYAKMTCALARLERINTDTGNAISTADTRDATENFFNHAYHLQKDFPAMAQRVEECITGSRVLSLVADLHNSFKHGGDIADRRRKHEKESGSPPVGDLVRINTHTKVDLDTTTAKCSQRMEITFQNATFDALELATETVREWDSVLAREGITLA